MLAQYSNTYEESVHTRVKDPSGAEHTLITNRIHPYFARVATGALLTVAAEGHVYAGEIENGAWVDAQHLQAGDELLGSDGQWQRVVGSAIEAVELDAYNLTVDGYSTYYVSGDGSAAGVWVHNVCFDTLPTSYKPTGTQTAYGQERFVAPNGEQLYRGHDGRFFNPDDHLPSAQVGENGSATRPDGSFDPRLWNHEIRFDGNRVFQRDDLIDPDAVDHLGRTNLERMRDGLAPVGPDSRSINLHHLTQSPTGAIAELTHTMHS